MQLSRSFPLKVKKNYQGIFELKQANKNQLDKNIEHGHMSNTSEKIRSCN